MKIFRPTASSILVSLIVAGSGCSSDSATAPSSTLAPLAASVPVASTTTSVATVLPVAPSGTGTFGGAASAACDSDRLTLEIGVEAYLALNGSGEFTEAELVTAGLLRQESILFDIAAGNLVVASPSGGCTT